MLNYSIGRSKKDGFDMEHRHLIAIYCRFNGDGNLKISSNDLTLFPKNVLNRIDKTNEVFVRLSGSHADDEFIKILLFGQQVTAGLKRYAVSLGLPEDRIEVDASCNSIAEMAKRIWERIRANTNETRVYFVLSNWQWIYVEPLLRLKDEQFKFFFEGSLDERSVDEIERDKKLEKVASISLKERRLGGMLDKMGGSISSNMKG